MAILDSSRVRVRIRVGTLTVIGKEFRIASRNGRVLVCECDCGKVLVIDKNSLRKGNSTTCGCWRNRKRTHGLSRKTPLYAVWMGMKGRCYNSNQRSFKDYGARGIGVCDEWRSDFLAFHDWAMSHGYEKGLDIDRRENDGNYEHDNCRFVTRRVNTLNTRRNVIIYAFGESKTISEWTEDPRCVVGRKALDYRVKSGRLSPEEMLTIPERSGAARRCRVTITAFGETKTFVDWLIDPRCVVKKACLWARIVIKKWDSEEALITPASPISRKHRGGGG